MQGPDDHQFGTVGAVALDAHGNIAAGTSTLVSTSFGGGAAGNINLQSVAFSAGNAAVTLSTCEVTQ